MASPPTADAPAPFMLSVSGCRGIFGQSMTPETAARFALVAGKFFRDRWAGAGRSGRPLIVLGRDGRLAGELLTRAASAGLAAAGCDVLDCGVAMTPTIGAMVDIRGACAGLVLTASHNPQQWNGLKPMIREMTGERSHLGVTSASAPSKATADALIAEYRAAEAAGARGVNVEDVGTITTGASGDAIGLPNEATFAHVQRVRDALQAIGIIEDRRWLSMRCVVDSVNSSGVSGAKALLGERIVHHLGSSDSGVFPHTPEPTRENLTQLARFTADKRAHVGFAQDPDADRLAIVDEHGSYIGEEYTLVLAAEAILGAPGAPANGATICVNLSTSRMIEDVAARYGARVIRTAVGEANVVEAMKTNGSIMGGEGNGGVIWPRVTYIRDSLGGMGLVLGLMARTGKSISQLVSDIPSYAIVKRKVDLPPGDLSAAKAAVSAITKAHAGLKPDLQDGVWVNFPAERAWLHVRGSNTEPIMRLIAESPTEAVAKQILDDAAAVIARG